MEAKKDFVQEFKDSKWVGQVDSDNDGVPALKATVYLNEAIQELLKRGVKKEDVKIVDFEFSGLSLKLKLDTDQDGEELMELEVNLPESFDEGQQKLAK